MKTILVRDFVGDLIVMKLVRMVLYSVSSSEPGNVRLLVRKFSKCDFPEGCSCKKPQCIRGRCHVAVLLDRTVA